MTTSVTVSADAKFLRRVLLALVALTVMAGAMAAVTTVQAQNKIDPANCLFLCE